MFKRMSFRAKLLLVLFVPFLALVVVAGAGLNDRFDALHAQEQYQRTSGALRALDELSRAVQNEAVVSSWYLVTDGAPVTALGSARSRTDGAVDAFRATSPALASSGLGAEVARALDASNTDLDLLTSSRRLVDQSIEASAARSFFLAIDDGLLALEEQVAGSLRDVDASATLLRLGALQRETHELAREAATSTVYFAGSDGAGDPAEVDPAEAGEWLRAIAAQQRERTQFLNRAAPAEIEALQDALVFTTPDRELPASFPQAPISAEAMVDSYRARADELDRGILAVQELLGEAADAHASDAEQDVFVYGGLAVFAMLVTLALMWFVTRAVVRPVRRLTAAARDTSQRQLPQLVEQLRAGADVGAAKPTAIEVDSEDEIGELAQAFNDVQEVTYEVAQEQSRLLRKGMGDLFVNLARRNQSLLERQLELLDQLERNEHDPTALDSLFKLDHMATRMRRNAESLLVLSGAEQPRQWQQPIAVLDVVRAAAAEITDFPRVELVGIDDELAISGRAVADVAHLIAELLENATSFSPPDTAVIVSGAPTASGYVIAISDQGIGMPSERISAANELLARPPAVGLALSRALGLHVVASLAARHDITVELRAGAPVGLVALVTLPSPVLASTRARDALPAEPQFTPDVDGDGESVPLGARRVAWRPPDEPPVEEWRRAGHGSGSPPTAPVADPPVVEPVVEPSAASPPAASPPPGPTGEPEGDDPLLHVPLRGVPLFGEPEAADEPPAANGGSTSDGDARADEPIDDGPLPTRIPGHHLSHQPSADESSGAADADPLRPYRVHEFLSRHEQGKRRGRAENDVLVSEDHGPEGEQ